jgi:raffinose/stachyose/melibiose transport system permease protein
MTDAALERPTIRPARMPRPTAFDTSLLYRYAALLFVAGLVLVPLLATAMGGLKTIGELRTDPFGLPDSWVWSNYTDILTGHRFWEMLLNSLIIALLTVALTVTTGAMVAFLFAHLTFFGDRYLLSYFMLGLLFPAATAILPLFIKIRDLGLLDSYWGVVLPQAAFGLGLSILLFRGFFRQLPSDLLEAALIDGCSYVRFFRSVTLPLSRPILATVSVFIFVQSWNNYLLPLVMLNSDPMFPWPLGLMQFQGEYMTNWPAQWSASRRRAAPAILMFLLAQKHIVAGITAGAVKG